MKRDMGLIRAIAIEVEAADGRIRSRNLSIEGYTEKQIGCHCELMVEASMLDVTSITHLGSPFPEYLIHRLTMTGHDFIDSARNEGIWQQSLAAIRKTVGTVSLDVLVQILKQEAAKSLGLNQEP